MTVLDPTKTTVGDLCTEALRESGGIGVGQDPLAEDINAAWARLQWMLQQWQRERYLVYHLIDLVKVSTGAESYTVGPTGDFPTPTRPDKLETGCFNRQINLSTPNQIDYPLKVLEAREDYNKIALKSLTSFPGYVFLDAAIPNAVVYPWPVPQASIYEIHLCVKEVLPASFPSLVTVISLPNEYYYALMTNLAIMMRPRYGLSTWPGDHLPALAKNAKAVIRGANTQIAALQTPTDLQRAGAYNILSDRFY